MRWISRLQLRLRSLLRKTRVEAELDDELLAHVGHETDALVAQGLSRAEAQRRALAAIGGVEQVKEACRDTRRVSRLEHLWQDLRYAVRLLRRSPGFALVAVLSLALGIGATTAIFSVVNAVLLRPLPFAEADRLVLVRVVVPQIMQAPISMPPGQTLEFGAAVSFEASATTVPISRDLSGVATPERLRGLRVSPSLFPLLGVTPLHGRAFSAADDRPGERVVILAHGLWQRQFSGDPGMAGRSILLDREAYRVVGVLPASFSFPIAGSMDTVPPADFFVPLAFTPEERADRGDNFNYYLMARLAPGVSIERANAEAAVIAKRIHATFPPRFRDRFELRGVVLPLFERVVGDSRRLLGLLFGAVGLLLAIACANVANMLLSRATGRGRELALRMALGAGRGRVVRQLLTESILLALAGGLLGAAIARAGTAMLLRWLPGNLPRMGEVQVDGTVLAFAIGLSVSTGVLFGLAPALSASRGGLQAALRDAGKGTGSSAHWNWLRQGFAVVQLAFALVLLTGAGLLLRSFLVILTTHPGFEPEGAVALELSLPATQYGKPEQARGFFDRLLQDLSALPGVRAVGAGSDVPYSWHRQRLFTPEPPVQLAAEPLVMQAVVEGRYFEVLGVPLRQGRLFTSADRVGAPPVVVVNDAFARRFYPDRPIVGARLKFGTLESDHPWITIVGVVGSTGKGGPDSEPQPHVYTPYAQLEDADGLRTLNVVARVTGDASALLPAIRARVHALDAHLPLGGLKTMETVMADELAARRTTAGLVSVFAVSALLLAALGLYGVLAYAVGQRTQEFGIRLALGAAPRQVLGLVVRQGLLLALAGVAIGLTLSALMGRVLASMLYGIGPFDAGVMVAVPLVLLGVALCACVIPARRAVRVDPMRTLRCE